MPRRTCLFWVTRCVVARTPDLIRPRILGSKLIIESEVLTESALRHTQSEDGYYVIPLKIKDVTQCKMPTLIQN
jgi:hypothetical protein